MADASTIYTVIGVTVVATGAGAFGREIVSKLLAKKNGKGNGKAKGDSFSLVDCAKKHSDVDIDIKGLQDDCKVFEKRLDAGSKDFKEINKTIHKIDKNVGVLIAFSGTDTGERNRRSTD